MAGTASNFIVQDRPSIDGYIQALPKAGLVNQVFVNRMSSVAVHNVTGDYVEVNITTVPVAPGNNTHFLAPGAAESFGNYPDSTITSIQVLDFGITGNGGGQIIFNGIFN